MRQFRPGELVRLKKGVSVPKGSAAYVIRSQPFGPVVVFTDAGSALLGDFEVAKTREPIEPFVPIRLRLPYGWWTEADGSRVFFSRDYCPMWRVSPAGSVSDVEPWEDIDFDDQQWFWNKPGRYSSPWSDRDHLAEIQSELSRAGISGLPRLAGILSTMIDNQVDDVRDAVALIVPPGAKYHPTLPVDERQPARS